MSKRKNFVMHQDKSSSLILFAGSVIINIVLCIVLFSGLAEEQMHFYFNSDTFYIPSLYRDLFVDNNSLAGWHLNGAPNFFPDLALYTIIRSFFHSFIPAAFTFSLVQLTLVLLLLAILYKQFFNDITYVHLTIGSLLMSFFLFETLLNHNFIYTFYLISVGYHVGAFIMALTALICMTRYYKTNRKWPLILMSLVIVVAVINDRLFLAMFSIPVFSLVFILKKTARRQRVIGILIADLAASVTGVFLFWLIKNYSSVYIIDLGWKTFNFQNIFNAAGVFFGQHLSYLSTMDFRGIIDVLFLVSLTIHIILLVRKLTAFYLGNEDITDELIYLLIFVSFTLVVLFMPVINGSYVAWSLLRYNIYALYTGVFSYAYLVYKARQISVLPSKTGPVFAGILMIAGIFLIVHAGRKQDITTGLKNFMHYYPHDVACIDSLAREYHFKNGLANYWDAKYITMFSHEGLRVFTVFPNLAPWYHVMNQNWYYKDDGSSGKSRLFTFIVNDEVQPESIEKYLGPPEDTLECTDNTNELLLFKPFRYNPENRRPFVPGAIPSH